MQCEVEANLEIDVTSLVSTKGFESKDGEPPREKFYLTTAINYTNGKWGEEPCVLLTRSRRIVLRAFG